MKQARFIQHIRSALGHPALIRRPAGTVISGDSHKTSRRLATHARSRGTGQLNALLQSVISNAEGINLKVIVRKNTRQAAATLAELAAAKETEWGEAKQVVAWDHPLIHELDLEAQLSDLDIPVIFTVPGDDPHGTNSADPKVRQAVANAYIGITSADYCLADTATLVMKARPGRPRSVSLVPVIHVAVIKLDQIISDLGELYALLGTDPREAPEGLTNCMTFITGPSKTADIEATMVHGAHGPREVHLMVITGEHDK
jgi:L-lactate dehydrogenase complex protein LldG